ncbi:MAG TPA: FAD-dependent monooxygenase [Mycobacteriales bacterium]|nr:FAD-dependent monooxygenase [Mycobacteriales bacterium]
MERRLALYDVLVAGCGPVGAVLAARLAAHDLRVLVVDPRAEVFALPRAVAADDEVQHLLDATVPGLAASMLGDQRVRLVDARRRTLGQVDFPRSASGYSGLAFFRQPVLERTLRGHLAELPGVDLRLGDALEAWAQDSSGVSAVLRSGARVRARWLVGCDGAASGVRQAAGIRWVGRDLAARWLVVDADGEVPERPGFTYTCDPARPQVDMPLPGGHRWEWRLRAEEETLDPRALIARDTDPGRLTVSRAVVYTFAARRAHSWRAGRVLLAGDAAHTMPPFAGQGVGAGIRDSWLLAELLAQRPTDPRQLDAYQALRAPHVTAMTRLSLGLGLLICLEQPAAARARDRALRTAFRTPGIGAWLRRGGPRPSSGLALPL